MRERLEAALYALGRGNVEETREHIRFVISMIDAPEPEESAPAETVTAADAGPNNG